MNRQSSHMLCVVCLVAFVMAGTGAIGLYLNHSFWAGVCLWVVVWVAVKMLILAADAMPKAEAEPEAEEQAAVVPCPCFLVRHLETGGFVALVATQELARFDDPWQAEAYLDQEAFPAWRELLEIVEIL